MTRRTQSSDEPCIAAAWSTVALALIASLGMTECATGQLPQIETNNVRQWGDLAFDTRVHDGDATEIACGWNNSAVLHADGRLFVQGQDNWGQSQVPEPPVGTSYVDVSLDIDSGIGLLSDGTTIGWGDWSWGSGPPATPPLPAGTTYTKISLTSVGLALRSDGVIVAWGNNNWGQANPPALPAGVSVVDLMAMYSRCGLVLSDGTLRLFGKNDHGQNDPPSLPPGVTYTALAISSEHSLALRSDGQIEAFGRSDWGQCTVPPLPPGTTYELVAAGQAHSVAYRSDGVFVSWGLTSAFGLDTPPVLAPGQQCVQLEAGQLHNLARMSDGSVVAWGHNDYHEGNIPRKTSPAPEHRYVFANSGYLYALLVTREGSVVDFGKTYGGVTLPPLPPGERYERVYGGFAHVIALRSDGQAFAWGDNSYGQSSIPPLPTGVTYTDVVVTWAHSVLLRSDGQAVAFGQNGWGECDIPALPTGMTYEAIAAYYGYTVLLRSDGALVYTGSSTGVANVPSGAPPGTQHVALIGSQNMCAALLSDGNVQLWGSAPYIPFPPLPWGVTYVEGTGLSHHIALRRSDGQIVVAGSNEPATTTVPQLDPGTSYVQVAGRARSIIGRVGPTSTYVGFAPGCSGSLPASRLVPRDTPRIGDTLSVRLFDLPADIAMIAMSFQQLASPLDLTALGMPGCTWHVPLEGVALLTGSGTQAVFELPIPDVPPLVGVRFYHQALVLDPQAGNGFSAVVSDAMEGVVGHW